jgi:hypothetical protein
MSYIDYLQANLVLYSKNVFIIVKAINSKLLIAHDKIRELCSSPDRFNIHTNILIFKNLFSIYNIMKDIPIETIPIPDIINYRIFLSLLGENSPVILSSEDLDIIGHDVFNISTVLSRFVQTYINEYMTVLDFIQQYHNCELAIPLLNNNILSVKGFNDMLDTDVALQNIIQLHAIKILEHTFLKNINIETLDTILSNISRYTKNALDSTIKKINDTAAGASAVSAVPVGATEAPAAPVVPVEAAEAPVVPVRASAASVVPVGVARVARVAKAAKAAEQLKDKDEDDQKQ